MSIYIFFPSIWLQHIFIIIYLYIIIQLYIFVINMCNQILKKKL